jgi:hypothetical protein
MYLLHSDKISTMCLLDVFEQNFNNVFAEQNNKIPRFSAFEQTFSATHKKIWRQKQQLAFRDHPSGKNCSTAPTPSARASR